jgi:UDP-N-acetylmuramyl pentapeptide phosphotransferase/UDP-N-acetylglucosamine-1-phosphate transferase
MGATQTRRWPGWLAWGLWGLAVLGLASVPWFDRLTRQAGRPELGQLNASTIPYLLAIVVAATVGAVLAGRLPRHPVGWLLLGVGLSVAGSGVADGYARYGLVARPGALPAARWVAIYSPATTLVGSPWSAMSCCSPRPGGCRRPAGAGGPGWPRPGRSPSWPP